MDLTNFKKISFEKQKIIINAGFLCFGKNGYKKTSVQDIACSAGISKASLFQYFGNKKDMYLFLCAFASKGVADRMPIGTEDFFECAKMYIECIKKMMVDYPNMFSFLVLQSKGKDFEEVEELRDFANEICVYNFNTIYANVDWSTFRAGFDKRTILNMFNWLFCGCLSQASSGKTSENVLEELLRCLQLLKESILCERRK